MLQMKSSEKVDKQTNKSLVWNQLGKAWLHDTYLLLIYVYTIKNKEVWTELELYFLSYAAKEHFVTPTSFLISGQLWNRGKASLNQ